MFPPCYVAAVEAATEQNGPEHAGPGHHGSAPNGPGRSEPEQTWPGERLGFPESGPGAVAGWGRRILALIIDWFLCLLAVAAVTRQNPWAYSAAGQAHERYAIGVLALEIWFFTSLIGGSAGQVVTRVAVRRVRGGLVDPIRVFARTVLILLVVPAVIYNHDHRGLHDLAVDSVVVRR
jgi:hypothetical protein